MFGSTLPCRRAVMTATAILFVASVFLTAGTASATLWTFSEPQWVGGMPNTPAGFKKILPDDVCIWNNTNANLDVDLDPFDHPSFNTHSLNQAVNTAMYAPNIQFDFTGNESWTTLPGAGDFSIDVQITSSQSTLVAKFYTDTGTVTYWPTLTNVGGNKRYGTIDMADTAATGPVRMVKLEFYGSGQTTAIAMDNFQYTLFPEPATMAMLGLGAAALLRRRRK